MGKGIPDSRKIEIAHFDPLNLFAFVFALGLGHHVSLMFPGVFFILYIFLVDPKLLKQPRRWLKPIGFFALGLLPLLYLPLRGATGGTFADGEAAAFLAQPDQFLSYVSGRGFEGDFFYFINTRPDLFLDRVKLLRLKDVGFAGRHCETGGQNADNRNRLAVQIDGSVYDARVGAEAPRPDGELVVGDGEGGVIPVRSEFPDTALWEAHVVTGDNGEATVTVTLPDNLTTWRMDARAITQDTRAGQTQVDIVSTKSLLVRPQTPRFFTAGDEAVVGTAVHNNSGMDLNVKVSLQGKGVNILDTADQEVTIPTGRQAYVTWRVQVPLDSDRVDLVFLAELFDPVKGLRGRIVGDDRAHAHLHAEFEDLLRLVRVGVEIGVEGRQEHPTLG